MRDEPNWYKTGALIKQIKMDAELQMRAKNDEEFVATLCDVLQDAKADLDPVILFEDKAQRANGHRRIFFVGDGNHRVMAYRLMKRSNIPAIVYEGGRTGAWRYALGANADQRAKPRTRADLRKAVTTALEELYFKKDVRERATQQDIADLCRTTQVTVSNILRRMEAERRPEPKVPAGPSGPPVMTQQELFPEVEDKVNETLRYAQHIRTDPHLRKTLLLDPREASREFKALADAMKNEAHELERAAVDMVNEALARGK